MKDSVTFGRALNLLKHPSEICTRSAASLLKHPAQHSTPQHKLHLFCSPKSRTIARRNTMLKDIFQEFGQSPQNQYVLQLGHTYKEEHYLKFDDWINSTQSAQEGLLPSGGKEQELKLKGQIEKEVEKIRLKTNPPPPPCSSHPSTEDEAPLGHSKNSKFSFSNFYSEEDKSEETITHISIMNTLEDDEVVQGEKENQNPNSCEIRGLEFSKKRKYKASKKRTTPKP